MLKLNLYLLFLFLLVLNSVSQKTYETKLLLNDWIVNVNNCPGSSKEKSDKNY